MIRLYQNLICRIRLWKICKKLRIKPYLWQKKFALGKTNVLEFYSVHQSGRTTAVILRLLMMDKPNSDEAACILACDPDWKPRSMNCVAAYTHMYEELYSSCYNNVVFPAYSRCSLLRCFPDLHCRKFSGLGKKAKWVRYPDYYRCPVCGSVFSNSWPLCPDCRAAMVGVWLG